MIYKVLDRDKEFLLGQHAESFEAAYATDPIHIPEHWLDFYFKQRQVNSDEVSELKLIEQYLSRDTKTLSACFYDSELPRDIQQSIQSLLRSSGDSSRPFSFKNKPFQKRHQHTLGRYDVLSSPYYIRQKFIDIDNLLRNDYKRKLFFVFEKTAHPPYQTDTLANYYFLLKDVATAWSSDTDHYLISDIEFLANDARFQKFLRKCYQVDATRGLAGHRRARQEERPETGAEVCGLHTALHIMQSLFPKVPLIHLGHQAWDQCKILLFEDRAGVLIKTNVTSYTNYLTKCFFENALPNNTGYACSEEELAQYGVRLIVKYSQDAQETTLNREEAIGLVKEHACR
jgi:hypothetical protein